MKYTFQSASMAFKNNQIRELASKEEGIRFLKLRSLSRKEHLNRLIRDHDLVVAAENATDGLRAVFESSINDAQIEATIRAIYSEERQKRIVVEPALITELYKLQFFDWGGLHQNSLERTIVDNYVKKINSFEKLNECVENELFHSMKSYALCSWYNHWTSMIIEDIFRDHPLILPAVGLIKKVDFFLKDVPYDLKVTYLPEGYIKEQRKQAGDREELSVLKTFCKEHNIHYDKKLSAARLLEDLWAKVADFPSPEAEEIIRELKSRRLSILNDARQRPTDLICWLYENQGVRRFDAANRLFLVLVDCDNFFESWKLKRNKPLLVKEIHRHLSQTQQAGYDLSFNWEGMTYSITSDIIFVNYRRP